MNNAIKCIGLVPLLFAGVLWAQEPQLANARVQSRSAEGRLDAVFRAVANSQIEPAWIGYAIAAVAGNHRICCGASSDRHLPSMLRKGRCKLEVRDEEMNFQTNDESKESGKTNYLLVLFRVSERKVGKIRVFSEECELDAGGLTVYWLTEVTSKASLPLLASFVQGGSQALIGG